MRPSEHEPSVCWRAALGKKNKKKRTEKDGRSELPSIRETQTDGEESDRVSRGGRDESR